MSAAREAFAQFFDADEVEPVVQAFEAMVAATEMPEGTKGLDKFAHLDSTVRGSLSFRHKRIFEVLKTAIRTRENVAKTQAEAVSPGSADAMVKKAGDPFDTRVFVSGAGPVGLRTAVENALLGHSVTIVERRGVFSRVNILMFWSQTMGDMVSLGAKVFYPKLVTHGSPMHMGTREIQLVLLKTALLLGVDVRYNTALTGLACDGDTSWRAAVYTPPKHQSGIRKSLSNIRKSLSRRSGEKAPKIPDALKFKPDKTADYSATFLCNMVEEPDVDFVFTNAKTKGTDIETIPFDALVIAEGEWSQTSKKLGFHKSVDRFSRAIGIVVNLDYDPTNAVEKGLRSFNLGFAPVPSAARDRLNAAGIQIETMEYLKGHTHYIVVSLYKLDSLYNAGVIKSYGGDGLLLRPENVDLDALNKFARTVATAVGLPPSAKFARHHAVQIFDFSTRARAFKPTRLLVSDAVSSRPEYPNDVGDVVLPSYKNKVLAPVFLTGDSLVEPFWPQGLGSNRGFHTAIDTAHAINVLRLQGLEDCLEERNFFYNVMVRTPWISSSYLNKFEVWTTDPYNRYPEKVTKGLVMQTGGRFTEPIPQRVQDIFKE
mmetsp:Transcript_10109/g.17785  ORF Transcript_10109/g.17785 Transcript_10109/m.17785 type:complete len:598 (+) Transcript_10109:95-1888(+)|eukprot:CAMPEP_0184557668 /NCGR_PEP_ID=MMETSP0199_2-20130426/43332_1 /TAXON_ID=1112570 /ORGANISM="Thraustochytrium sp., Strain LLF1b" /LENGTH=597 /DNA_ID=CAMNT_0026954639 /DNA_START=27 /DNA_END=1820 /DNA_ORIENTATION=-